MNKSAWELAEERGLRMYSQRPEEDMLLLGWHVGMIQDGEFLNVFYERNLAFSNFLTLFQPPALLLYKTDDAGVSLRYAAWFTPTWFGAFGGVWTCKDLRGTHRGEESFQLGQAVFAVGFSLFDLLGGLTTNEPFLDRNAGKGYTVWGKIPHQMNGRDQYLVFYTKEEWQKGPFNPFQG